jgi:hypothetical protein
MTIRASSPACTHHDYRRAALARTVGPLYLESPMQSSAESSDRIANVPGVAAITLIFDRRPIRSRAVEAMLLHLCLFRADRFASAESICHVIHVRNRHELARELRREGLPPCSTVAPWVRVLVQVLHWEMHGRPPHRLAYDRADDPSPIYRMIRRTTGLRWGELRSMGSRLVLELVVADWGPPPAQIARATEARPPLTA